MTMKQSISAALVLLLVCGLYSCQNNSVNGQLVGVSERPSWNNINPYGMVYIPSGTFHIGQSDQDINNTQTQRSKSVSIQGFYMDDTEITCNEYRQFVHWVRDSIALTLLDAYIETEDGTGEKLDWDYVIDWEAGSEDAEALTSMFYSGEDEFWDTKEIDADKLIFSYEWYDWASAASINSSGESRSKFIRKEEVSIYPDTLTWIADFSYSYNEPMTRNYFWHPAFDDYPVVGVNWVQANGFCAWRTKLWNDFAKENGETMSEDFRLPFEHEWEYAARGGLENAPYPWGGPYIRNRKGCLLANFKPGRGNYPEDGGFYTVKVASYHPNDYGLFDMSGNVAEWTSSAYNENAYSFIHDMNSNIRYDAAEDDPITLKRKVLRGGSWKDIGYYLQTGTRHWEYQDTAKSYIGFRTALTFLGRSMGDFKNN